jgi:hypothetical protein
MIVNNELGRMWRGAAMSYCKVLSWHLLVGLGKAWKNFSQDSYWTASKHKPESLMLEPSWPGWYLYGKCVFS